jgi:hypothetical protein
MIRKLSIVSIILLAAAIAAWAGEPWQQKSDKQWDEVDLNRILFDSPWARKVLISFDVIPNTLAPTGSRPSAAGGGDPGSPSGGEANVPDMRGGGITYTVQWASSLTIRRAVVRSAIRRGALSEVDGEKSLEGQVDYYGIAVISGNLLDFQKLNEAALEKVTYLKAKKSKDKLAPSSVETQRAADGKTLTAVLFHFPKKLANGEPTVAPDEKSVEFVSHPGTLMLRAVFEPQKMAAQQGPDW